MRGDIGAKSDFEKLALDARKEVRATAETKIRRQHGQDELETDVQLSVALLRKGAPFILNVRIEDDRHSIQFDGLKKVDGVSILGDFHYER